MFLSKYLDDFYFNLVINNYEEEYLNTLDEDNFIKIYQLFNDYNFYFINDIVLNYLEIFTMPSDLVKNKIETLKQRLGFNFVNIIGNNMKYLNELLY